MAIFNVLPNNGEGLLEPAFRPHPRSLLQVLLRNSVQNIEHNRFKSGKTYDAAI